MGCAVVWWLAC